MEAGFSPDFQEIEPEDDLFFRRRAWKEFAERMRRGEFGDLYEVFEVFGLDQAALGLGFEKFAEYPDIVEWPGDGASPDHVDVAGFARGVT